MFQEFTGNSNMSTVVSHELNPPIKARFIRFRPLEWNGHICMRVELYGCTQGMTNTSFGYKNITAMVSKTSPNTQILLIGKILQNVRTRLLGHFYISQY